MSEHINLQCKVERLSKNKIRIALTSEMNDDFRIIAILASDNVVGIEDAVGGDGEEMDSNDLYELLSRLV